MSLGKPDHELTHFLHRLFIAGQEFVNHVGLNQRLCSAPTRVHRSDEATEHSKAYIHPLFTEWIRVAKGFPAGELRRVYVPSDPFDGVSKVCGELVSESEPVALSEFFSASSTASREIPFSVAATS